MKTVGSIIPRMVFSLKSSNSLTMTVLVGAVPKGTVSHLSVGWMVGPFPTLGRTWDPHALGRQDVPITIST